MASGEPPNNCKNEISMNNPKEDLRMGHKNKVEERRLNYCEYK